MQLKQCKSCGTLIKILQNDSGCAIQCCGEEMETVIPNSVDAAIEKHIPTYEIVESSILVRVPHVMEDEHFIKWISLVTDTAEYTVTLTPGNEAIAKFPYIPNSVLYSYCNKHGLWKTDVQ